MAKQSRAVIRIFERGTLWKKRKIVSMSVQIKFNLNRQLQSHTLFYKNKEKKA
jgi:hypothetical protein